MPTSPDRAPSVRAALDAARAAGRCAFIPYITLGYPTLPASLRLLHALEEEGADVVEVGIPFSDPVADGPTIQHTIDVALEQGATLRRILEALRADSAAPGPRLLFSYLNPLLSMGLEPLLRALPEAGIRGVLVTDLIPEEAREWLALTADHGIEPCFLVSSTSDDDRIDAAVAASRAFCYVISTLGVTGARTQLDDQAAATVRRVRSRHDIPLAVGFGISTPADVRRVRDYADGVVVGSALLDRLRGFTDEDDVVRVALEFVRPLLRAAHD